MKFLERLAKQKNTSSNVIVNSRNRHAIVLGILENKDKDQVKAMIESDNYDFIRRLIISDDVQVFDKTLIFIKENNMNIVSLLPAMIAQATVLRKSKILFSLFFLCAEADIDFWSVFDQDLIKNDSDSVVFLVSFYFYIVYKCDNVKRISEAEEYLDSQLTQIDKFSETFCDNPHANSNFLHSRGMGREFIKGVNDAFAKCRKVITATDGFIKDQLANKDPRENFEKFMADEDQKISLNRWLNVENKTRIENFMRHDNYRFMRFVVLSGNVELLVGIKNVLTEDEYEKAIPVILSTACERSNSEMVEEIIKDNNLPLFQCLLENNGALATALYEKQEVEILMFFLKYAAYNGLSSTEDTEKFSLFLKENPKISDFFTFCVALYKIYDAGAYRENLITSIRTQAETRLDGPAMLRAIDYYQQELTRACESKDKNKVEKILIGRTPSIILNDLLVNDYALLRLVCKNQTYFILELLLRAAYEQENIDAACHQLLADPKLKEESVVKALVVCQYVQQFQYAKAQSPETLKSKLEAAKQAKNALENKELSIAHLPDSAREGWIEGIDLAIGRYNLA